MNPEDTKALHDASIDSTDKDSKSAANNDMKNKNSEIHLLFGLSSRLSITHLLQTQVSSDRVSELLTRLKTLLEEFSTGPPKDGPLTQDLCVAEPSRIDLGALAEAFGQGITSVSSSSSDMQIDQETPDTLLDRITESQLPPALKQEVVRKLQRRTGHEGESLKLLTWAETLLRLPLGKTVLPDPSLEPVAHFEAAREILASVCHGQEQAKEALLERHFQWLLTPLMQQRPLALVGPPGCGKTTLLLRGCSDAMQRPVRLLALGAANDASSLLGHGFTYEGSQAGFIIETLIETQCMNPILVLDELDKISTTNRGDEVLRCLLQLTDPLQTRLFRDRYLGTLMPVDLSAALLLFSMNSSEGLIPALLDRLEIVSLASLTRNDYRTVIMKHLFPSHLKKMNIDSDVVTLTHPSMESAAETLANAAQQNGLRWVDLLLHKAVLRALAHVRGCDLATQFRGSVVWTMGTEGKLLLSHEGLQQLIQALTPSSPILSYVI